MAQPKQVYCPNCGSEMIASEKHWTCPECGAQVKR